nr:DUF692 family multinuclear iron-containing protein [uncultured Actinoplanes sp.]
MTSRRELGVGLVYRPALEPVLDDLPVSVLELEPQTTWEKVRRDGRWCYRDDPQVVERLAERPHAKLLHGIGQPVGGSCADPVEHLPLLRATADRLGPVWVSEQLSFNRVPGGETGCLLPPPQTAAAVRVAAANVAAYGRALGRPVAFGTGANHLAPRPGELSDGDFWAAVSRRAGSGIVLDLHNLWCNQRAGRDRVRDVLRRLPLDQVWEIHLAGGMAMDGSWLDARSDRIPGALAELAATVIPRLPNLGAIVVEVPPEHYATLGPDGLRDQVDLLSRLWDLRPPARAVPPVRPGGDVPQPTGEDLACVRRGELDLHRAISGGIVDEPGIDVYRALIADFRRGSLARALRYTMTLLLLHLGSRGTHELLDAYFAGHPADAYRAVEADRFAAVLRGRTDLLRRVPHLDEVLSYERALVRATAFDEHTLIAWTADPAVILRALDRGTIPPPLPAVRSEMVIAPS